MPPWYAVHVGLHLLFSPDSDSDTSPSQDQRCCTQYLQQYNSLPGMTGKRDRKEEREIFDEKHGKEKRREIVEWS